MTAWVWVWLGLGAATFLFALFLPWLLRGERFLFGGIGWIELMLAFAWLLVIWPLCWLAVLLFWIVGRREERKGKHGG